MHGGAHVLDSRLTRSPGSRSQSIEWPMYDTTGSTIRRVSGKKSREQLPQSSACFGVLQGSALHMQHPFCSLTCRVSMLNLPYMMCAGITDTLLYEKTDESKLMCANMAMFSAVGRQRWPTGEAPLRCVKLCRRMLTALM